MLLSNYLDTEKLSRYVQEGWVMQQKHPFLPLSLYTYSRKTVFEDLWDDITTKTRCLIANDETGEIVARSFEKFFNVNTTFAPETWVENLPEDEPLVLEKLDGSLGVLYTYEGKDYIASKGSFTSEHAKWATKFYNSMHTQSGWKWPEGYTPVFEMICQGVQHHIVHYKKDDLVLTALINIETGEELPYDEMFEWAKRNWLRVPKKFTANVDILGHDTKNEEGYVLSWPRKGKPPLKIKVKFPNFLRKQKIINHTNPKDILQMMAKDYAEGTDSIPELVAETTDEFTNWVFDWEEKLDAEYSRILEEVGRIYNSALLDENNHTRKDYALVFCKPENKPYSAALFCLYDNDLDAFSRAIWKMCEPLVIGQSSMKVYNNEDE